MRSRAGRAKFTHQVNVRLETETYKRLVVALDHLDVPVSEYLRTLVENNLTKLEAKAAKTP